MIDIQLKAGDKQPQKTYVSKEHIKCPEFRDIPFRINLSVTTHYYIYYNLTILKTLPSASLNRCENINIPNCSSINQCPSMQLQRRKDTWNWGWSQNCIGQLFSALHITSIKHDILRCVSISCWNINLSLELIAISKIFQVCLKWSIVVNTTFVEDSLNNAPRPALQYIRRFYSLPSVLYFEAY